jgi:signal peptidase II
VAVLIVIFVVSLDVVTKFLIVQNLTLYKSSITVLPNFLHIVHYKNTGAAFSLGANLPFNNYFFSVISSIALIILCVAFKYTSGERKLAQIALPLLMGGTLGNLIDRVRWGAVVDFILVHWYNTYYWPAFNVADSAISIGVILLVIEMLRKE